MSRKPVSRLPPGLKRERELMLQRQDEGIDKAKAAGRYRGRKPTAQAKAGDVWRLHSTGMGATAIAGELHIGRASVYRILSSDPELATVV